MLSNTTLDQQLQDAINSAISSAPTWAQIKQLILDNVYPVGSIYFETTNTNPSAKLGGTWVAYGAADTYLRLGGNSSGGSNAVKLAANQIPSITTGNQSANHNHTVTSTAATEASHSHQFNLIVEGHSTSNTIAHSHYIDTSPPSYGVGNQTLSAGPTPRGAEGATKVLYATASQPGHTHTITTSVGNQSASHTHTYTNNSQANVSIEPKYVQVYAWKRTA